MQFTYGSGFVNNQKFLFLQAAQTTNNHFWVSRNFRV
jgi:hypothetical protein